MKRSNNKQRHYRSISVKLAKEAVAKFRGDKLRKTVMKKKELLSLSSARQREEAWRNQTFGARLGLHLPFGQGPANDYATRPKEERDGNNERGAAENS